MRILLILLAIPLLALDNAKTVYNRTASALTSYPVTLHYWLAPGEVTDYPRPYLTPSDTGARTAAASWQADVKSRWRDMSNERMITGVTSGDPWWSVGVGLTSIRELPAVSGVEPNIAEITTTVPHNLKIGDRVVISLATGDNDLNRDHYTVIETPASTTTFKVRTQSVAPGTYSNAGLTVTHVIEPWGSGQCRIKSPLHGLEVSESVTISGVGGITGVNGTWLVSAVSRDAFLINTTCSGTYVAGGSVVGPDFGSVKSAHVSFWTAVPASGNVKVDVVNSTDACHLGSQAVCRESSTPVAAMTQDISWGLQLDATAVVVAGSTATKSTNAKTMLAAWNGVESYCGTRYWLRGPVVTEWIIEDGCATRAYDFGWKTVMSSASTYGNTLNGAITASQTSIVTTSTPTFTVGSRLYFAGTTSQYIMSTETMLVTAISGNTVTVERGYQGSIPYAHANAKSFGVMQWEDSTDAAYKNLHPSFAVRYYPGWSGVRVEVRMENPYWEKLASAWYAPTIKTGAALATRWSRGETNHPARARWRKIFWDGSDPEHFCSTGGDPDGVCTGGTRQAYTRVDHNRKYLEYAGALEPRNDADSAVTMDQWINGYLSSSTGWRYGWHYTDKGDYGVARKMDADQIDPVAPALTVPVMPYLYPGEGNINNEFRANWAAARNWTSDNSSGGWQSAEGWWPMPTEALWLHTNFSDGGYEMAFGTSVRGGGGNSAVEGHLQMFIRESASRAYVAGWPDLATGRNVSLHSRPNMTTFHTKQNTSGAEDSFGQACANAVTFAPGSALFGAQIWWPCAAGDEGFASGTVTGLEPGHLSDYQSIPWIITGDDWFWQGLAMKAAWSAGLGYSAPLATGTKAGRNIGKIHAEAVIAGNHIRMRTWPEMSIVQALMATPTEPLFGQSYIPERALLNAYAWDFALFAEGYQNKTDGWAAKLFPLKFTTDMTGFSAALTAPSSSDRWRTARFMSGPNANGYFHPAIMSLTDCSIYGVDLVSVASGCDSSHQNNYEASVMTHARDVGLPQFKYARVALGKWYINGILNRNTNPFLLGQYRDVTKLTNSPIAGAGQRPQSWTEFFNAYVNTSSGKLRNAWYTGTIGFSMKLIAGVRLLADIDDATTPGCTATDKPPIGCTGAQAAAFADQSLQGQDYATISDDPRWAGIIVRPIITNLSASLSGGTATLRWIAPDGAACKVAINPTSSYDTTDATATAVGRMQSYAVVATAGDTYRITCGQARVKGAL